MGASKAAYFNKRQNQLALLSKALAHPARIAIVDYLLESNSCICNDIVGVLPLSQPTVSQHLRELKEAGLITGSIDGNSVCYCLNTKMVSLLYDYLNEMHNSALKVKCKTK